MFLVSDKLDGRRAKIRGFLEKEPAIAVLLAAADFEWTIRRAILLLGKDSTTEIRDTDLHRVAGLARYERAWESQVQANHGKSLRDVLALSADESEFLEKEAIQLIMREIVRQHGVMKDEIAAGTRDKSRYLKPLEKGNTMGEIVLALMEVFEVTLDEVAA